MANAPQGPRSRARTRAARPVASRTAGTPGTRAAERERAASKKVNPLVAAAQILLGLTLSCSIGMLIFAVLGGLAYVVYEYILH